MGWTSLEMGRPKPVARSVSMNDTSWWSKRWISPNIATSISNVSICWSSKTVKSMVLASSNCSMAASTSWSNKANRLVGEWRDGHLPGYLEEHPRSGDAGRRSLVEPFGEQSFGNRHRGCVESIPASDRPSGGDTRICAPLLPGTSSSSGRSPEAAAGIPPSI